MGEPSTALEDKLFVEYEEGCPPAPLPAFAVWAIRLGRKLFREAASGERRYVTLVVPSLRFVSTFIAIGVLDAAFREHATKPAFSPGDTVSYFDPATNRVTIGEYLGSEERPFRGQKVLYHLVEVKGGGVLGVPDGHGCIKPTEGTISAKLPRATGFEGQELPDWLPAVGEVYGYDGIVQWLAEASTTLQLVGVKSQIERDANESFHTCTGGCRSQVRLKRLLLWPSLGPWSSPVSLLAAGSTTRPGAAPITVFEGATAVSYELELRRDGVKVAIIAPVSPRAEEVLSELHTRLQFHDPDPSWRPGDEWPSGIEWSCHLV
ncbi:MAG TPA: hypothetical protein VFF10_09975 [Trueperaceae bacterium]|nr:hypothetical protein [Trueperaceae bacterium]